jgi:hypothetical protein
VQEDLGKEILDIAVEVASAVKGVEDVVEGADVVD